jgi:sugar/nucleoside kinase (ribokinase family)
VDFLAFGVILDDIVLPDGREYTSLLGGGGPQAAFGMRLWARSGLVGIAGGVGHDFPADARAWFTDSGIDANGLRVSSLPSLRARQVMEPAGRRVHEWLTPPAAIGPQLRRSLDLLPEAYRRPRGLHFGVHPEEPDLELAAALRRMGTLVSVESFRPATNALDREALFHLLSTPHIFSATLDEAESLVGPGAPRSVARRLIENGASILALRLGGEGSLVLEGQTGRGAQIPALPVDLVNPVGAGNAYCGGFLVGWAETRDVVTAGLYGAVAASFVLERMRLPVVGAELQAEAHKRLETLRASMKVVGL